MIVDYIDRHRDGYGVEPICRVLTEHGCKIAPNTYWVPARGHRRSGPAGTPSWWWRSGRVYAENLFVYGADKVWAQLNRENIRVARCTVERLMRVEGLGGARRGKAFTITTHADGTARQTWSSDGSRRRPRTGRGSRI